MAPYLGCHGTVTALTRVPGAAKGIYSAVVRDRRSHFEWSWHVSALTRSDEDEESDADDDDDDDDSDSSDDDEAATGTSDELAVGTHVMLSDDYHSHGDAAGGPLRPGQIGVIEGAGERRRQVRRWWYDPQALVPVHSTGKKN